MKAVLISYHYHPHSGYRSSLVHSYFLKKLAADKALQEYIFLHSDWDHQTKVRFEDTHEVLLGEHRKPIQVPAYFKNLSLNRVYSHLCFSWKVLTDSSLKNADLVYICVPPSFSALGPALKMTLRRKPWMLDLVDLWPEALPVSKTKKFILQMVLGKLWIGLRNIFYAQATHFISHCKYFLNILPLSSARSHFIPLAQAQCEIAERTSAQRVSIDTEIRILVLGSINHVLDSKGLIRLLKNLSSPLIQTVSPKNIILEIIGAGENKALLIQSLKELCLDVEVLDHGINFDIAFKRNALARCHFGYNGYDAQTAIGITYKSIDFCSQGLAILNSVQGDLRELVDQYKAGFNYEAGEEAALANRMMRLSEIRYSEMRTASKKIYEDLFTLEKFNSNMDQLLNPYLGLEQNP